ncbi:type II secretion system protein [Candidatus Saccharibacteria bacterium]|nr:type II secretion system protein [Candidatus Saccharibacteria bacterium]
MVKNKGFTIVELLIVIVVIAILAAITIVAYNGIQTRAENTKTMSAVRSYATAIMSYQAQNGHYPKFAGWPCLGKHPTSCGKRTSNTSNMCIGGGAGSQIGFEDEMKTIFNGQVPEPSAQRMTCRGDSYSGAWFHGNSDGTSAEIMYYLKGNVSCDVGSGLRQINRIFDTETTGCHTGLPAI